MKLSSKNRSTFLVLLGLGFLIGSLAWEALERILLQLGIDLSLGIGPVGFDLSVIKLFVIINPGTFLGILVGTDYNPGGVKGIGPKTALKLVRKKKSLESVFADINWEFDPTPKDIFDFFYCMKGAFFPSIRGFKFATIRF